MPDKRDVIKQTVAKKAAELIEEDMIVGLGSGSTASFFIKELIVRVQQGLRIEAVATSIRSAELAKSGGIPLLSDAKFVKVDLCIDGADEVDPKKRLIKGGGGNLLREKIVASSAHEMIVIVDESKLVNELGAFGLPVEVAQFGHQSTLQKLSDLGYKGKLRMQGEQLFVTDNGNHVVDIPFYPTSTNPEKDNERIRSVPGVLETGFFFNIAGRILVATHDGQIVWK